MKESLRQSTRGKTSSQIPTVLSNVNLSQSNLAMFQTKAKYLSRSREELGFRTYCGMVRMETSTLLSRS